MAKDSHKSHKKHRHHKSRKRSRSSSKGENGRDSNAEVTIAADPNVSTRSGVDVSLSIDETNALRAKLGLAPLETGQASSSNDKHVDNQSENYVHAPAKDLKRIKESEILKEKINVQKEKRNLYEKLVQEKPLSSADNETSVQSWVEKLREKERIKKQAQERAKSLTEMDEQFGVSDLVESSLGPLSNRTYRPDHLTGLKVEHNIDRFEEGRSVVLTLKDKGILDEDDSDVLVNVNIVDDEKADVNRENLRKTAGLAGIADQEDEDVLMGLRAKSLLSKYDNVIDGPNKSQFVIGQDGAYVPQNERLLKELEMQLSKNKQSLPDVELRIASEFYTPEEMNARFKKRKRRVKAVRERLTADDLVSEPVETGNSDLGSRSSRESRLRTNAADEESKTDGIKLDILNAPDQRTTTQEDYLEENWEADDYEPDELRGDLEKAINHVIRSKPISVLKPEEVAAQLLVRKQETDAQTSNSDQKPTGIVFDATAEFYKSINLGFQESMSRNTSRLGQYPSDDQTVPHTDLPLAPMKYESNDNDSDVPMNPSDSDEETDRKQNAANRWQTVGEDGANGVRAQPKTANGFPPSASSSSATTAEPVSGVLDDEPRLDSGVFSALRLASKKGYIDKDKEKRTGTGTMVNLMAKHFVQEEIRYDDIDAKFAKRNRYSGPLSDFKEMTHYKPDVKLEYVDELGRELNAKEAFRQLSHKFHGKGSGKNKTEKRMKKIKEEFLLKASTSSDTPLGTAEKLSKKLQSMATPYVILSGKNAAVKKLTK